MPIESDMMSFDEITKLYLNLGMTNCWKKEPHFFVVCGITNRQQNGIKAYTREIIWNAPHQFSDEDNIYVDYYMKLVNIIIIFIAASNPIFSIF